MKRECSGYAPVIEEVYELAHDFEAEHARPARVIWVSKKLHRYLGHELGARMFYVVPVDDTRPHELRLCIGGASVRPDPTLGENELRAE